MTITVENPRRKQRLDSYLTEVYTTLSRSSVKKLVLSKLIKVNDEIPKVNRILREGDKVEIDESRFKEFIDSNNLTEIDPVKMDLDIMFENDTMIVLNKDEGVVVHPSYNHLNDTLMNGLTYYIINGKEPFTRIRPVNRLDKDTSGVILFSKDIESHNFYSKQFKKREVTKEYWAVVNGNFLEFLNGKDSIKISGFLTKKPLDLIYRVTMDSVRGEYAETEIYFEQLIIKEDQEYSLLRVVPQTGRTHQIRVHLASVNFPIVGDTLYGGVEYERVLLHSRKLKIVDFKTKELLVFEANPKRWI